MAEKSIDDMYNDADTESITQPVSGAPLHHQETTMFVELQELVARVKNGLQFGEDVFEAPVAAHFRVLWLQTARWINFEQNYDEVEQRFTETHVSPMKFTRVAQLCEELRKHCKIINTDADTLGEALGEVAFYARTHGCINTPEEYDVLRAVLLAERWHPEVKGHISDVAEFEQYWQASMPEAVNLSKDAQADKHIKALHSMISVHHQSQHPYHRFNHNLTNCLEAGTEACTVLAGTIEFLSKPIVVLIRLRECIQQSCISEVAVPVRFIFIYLGPKSEEIKYTRMGRVFAVMMSNNTFRSVIYESNNVSDVLRATDMFMTDALVMPITRYANPEALAGMVRQIEAFKRELGYDKDSDRRLQSTLTSRRLSQLELAAIGAGTRKLSALNLAIQDGALAESQAAHRAHLASKAVEQPHKGRRFVQDFCPPCSDFFRGVRPWLQRMPSDYRDALTKDNVGIVFGSVLFLYFVNMAPSITFAALLNTQIDPGYTISLTLLSSGVYLFLFTMLGGQPLGFIGITGPMFILESTIMSVAREAGAVPSQVRFWVAVYCAIFGFLFITFNAAVLANHIRRSVEEIFNCFIAFFFLLKALFTMFRLIPGSLGDGANTIIQLDYSKQLAIAGATLFLAFIQLQFCLWMAELKRGNYFRRFIRKLLGALNVPLGMLLITALNQIFFLGFELPTIDIPPSNQINASRWINMPDYTTINDYSVAPVSLVHGIGLAIGFTMAIILYTEVALNGITAMKNKAVKSNIFVMDLILLVIVFPIISGSLGWPFVSGATVRTMSNLVALVKMERAHAPGMPHRVIGTVEQRVSGMVVGLLLGLSIFLGSILRFIPLAALYGMFLYMGVMGLRDLQFFQRSLTLFKRRKHWEDWECVRGLPSKHILVFALIQGLVVAILVILNIVSEFTAASYAGIVFPIVILVYAVLREVALPRWAWLDLYLHQLDRKYKLNPPAVKATASLARSISMLNKESVVSFNSGQRPYSRDNLTAEGDCHTIDTDSSGDYSDHEDGVVRRTWAT